MTPNENAVIHTVMVGLGRIGWGTHLPALLAHSGFSVRTAPDPAAALDGMKRILNTVPGPTLIDVPDRNSGNGTGRSVSQLDFCKTTSAQRSIKYTGIGLNPLNSTEA